MQTQITARHFDAKSPLRDHINTRLSKLERFYDGITDAHVILGKDGDPTQDKHVEVSLGVFRQRLTAEKTAPTFEAAVDACVESLRRQILKYKARLRNEHERHVRVDAES